MATAPTSTELTAEDLLALQGDGRRELIGGILHELAPAGVDHGRVVFGVAGLLYEYCRDHGGAGLGAETGFLLARNPDTVRAPDAAYLGPERTPTLGSAPSYFDGSPDLAVEVVSPGDTYSEVHGKALAWVAAGCGVVLVVDPKGRRVTRYRAADDVVVFAGDQPVDCAPAMPGFAPTASKLLGAQG